MRILLVTRAAFAGLLTLVAAGVPAQAPDPEPLRGFAGGALQGDWEPLEFESIPRHTVYRVVTEGDGAALRAESEAAASGLVHPLDVDPREFRRLRWRWKVQDVVRDGDVTRRDRDDYAARVYVAFAYDPDAFSWSERLLHRAARLVYGPVPGYALNYIWANGAERDQVYPSPYTDLSRMIAVRNAQDPADTWLQEERDVYADYRRIFGREPPRIVGVGLMTDTDNTGAHAVAHYAAIALERAAE